ncbi:hypothetical protein NrS5_50 [Nitratiruptor phage NrS-5]|uniref:DUF2460 domain-containing protein n=1 Tax=unclassified Nitratiruptor TaxID=2624044 RepID=UPI00191654B7|nr:MULTISPECIES: DUF2460 domain-containing protein [unclassified Nitratiruptor]BCD61754.1 hypothetical protein NitYY0813_C0614 [Nitratiruptor sp. YY08-13]BCD65689.1 hypothetical protein NitYY0826_C0616 [Nitratiruptor sp. YY08-26]BCD83232.1 hypothetical protein NrS4_50 [Nitratiruptor phage NrS-4]BCD83291.1 hypothetical protein NrS5_50 [Nitratiruptor phage NrS-5]
MYYVVPQTKEISTTYNGKTYKRLVYKPFKSASGIIDENYPEWDSTTTYNQGEYVIYWNRIYRSAADGNQGNFPLEHPDMWVDYGFVNSYRMFSIDEGIGAVTKGSDVVLEFDFVTADTIALIGAKWNKVIIEQVDNDEAPITGESLGQGDGATTKFATQKKPVYMYSETVYIDGTQQMRDQDYAIDYFSGEITFANAPASGANITIDYTPTLKTMEITGRDYGATSFYEYFYSAWADKTRLIINDFTRLIVDGLVWTPNSTLRLTFTGDVEIGAFVMGLQEDLGATLYGSSMQIQDKSKVMIDEFTGARKIVRYGKVRVLKALVYNDMGDFSEVARKINAITGKNVLWIPSEEDRFAEMSNIAYISDADLPIDNPKALKASMNLIGVIE